jgi:hypothetical protein
MKPQIGEVRGLKEALKTINRIEPDLRKSITREYKQIMAPVVRDAKALSPNEAPLSGWDRKWTTPSGFQMLPWNGRQADRMINSGISTRRAKQFRGNTVNLATMFVKWKGAVNTIYDIAGRGGSLNGKGLQMANALAAKYGQPSRTIYPAYEKNREKVDDEIGKLVWRVSRELDRIMAKRV